MPSIQDVADQINAKLDSINNNTTVTASKATATLDVAIEIESEVHNGFTNLSHGLFAVVELQRSTIQLLDHHRQQNDTIICELSNANQQLCNLVHKFERLLVMTDATRVATLRIEGIAERVNPDAAADYDRGLAIHAKIEACCPPDQPEPEPCPEPCDRSGFDPRRPQGQKWEPLPTDRKPIG
jgi:hypothetical protein